VLHGLYDRELWALRDWPLHAVQVAECTPWATVQRAAWEALKKAKSETSGRRGWKHSPTSATGTAWERTPGLRVWLGVRAMGDA